MNSMKNFSSTTAKVKYLILDYMSREEREYGRRELVAHIYENFEENEYLSDGVIAGAIKILISSGELTTVKRGYYKRGSGKPKATCYERILNVCRRFEADLERACTINILELTPEELEVYPELKVTLDSFCEEVGVHVGWLSTIINVEGQTEEGGIPIEIIENPDEIEWADITNDILEAIDRMDEQEVTEPEQIEEVEVQAEPVEEQGETVEEQGEPTEEQTETVEELVEEQAEPTEPVGEQAEEQAEPTEPVEEQAETVEELVEEQAETVEPVEEQTETVEELVEEQAEPTEPVEEQAETVEETVEEQTELVEEQTEPTEEVAGMTEKKTSKRRGRKGKKDC